MIRDALRDRGVPTWRDLDDLGPEPTEDELVQTLNDVGIAGAIMLVSPQVATSAMVRVVEAPAILDRYKKRDGFLLKPVLINLDYPDIDRVLDRPGAFQELSRFDILKVPSETLQTADATRIARAVVKLRLRIIKTVDPDAPFELGLFMPAHATLSANITDTGQGPLAQGPMTAERESMTLQEMDAPALGVRDEAPRAGASHARPTPDPEVVAKPKTQVHRQYRRILEEAESCNAQPGEVGRLLRREGLTAPI